MKKLKSLKSDRQRIIYLAETVKEITGLTEFPEYLTLLFEIDSLIVNDDRHLNNIAVIEDNEQFFEHPCARTHGHSPNLSKFGRKPQIFSKNVSPCC